MKFLVVLFAFLSISCSKNDGENSLDKLDPSSPNVESELEKLDREYEAATGKKAHIAVTKGTCRSIQCPVFALVDRNTQTLTLYVDGVEEAVWPVSTGAASSPTPDFNKNPNGRIYDEYTSKTNPGGDYEGLGNMPYAVFIHGGYAIHGTTRGNFKKLGTIASHGCIRLHPDNAKIFNQLVRKNGVANVWIVVQ